MTPDHLKRVATMMMMMMEDNGIIIDDYDKMTIFIYHAFNDDRVKFFQNNGKSIGFVMWEVIEFGDGVDIYISQMVILPEFRGINVYREMESIKKKYKKIYKVSWHRRINGEPVKMTRYLKKEFAYGTA